MSDLAIAPSTAPQGKSGFEPPLELMLNELTLGVVQLNRVGEVLHANGSAQALIEGAGGAEVLGTLREMTARSLEIGDFIESVLSLGALGEVRVLVSPARFLDGCLAVLERGLIQRLRAESNALRAMLGAATDAATPAEAAHRALSTLAATLKGSYLVLYECAGGQEVRALAQVGVPGPHAEVLAARRADDPSWLIGRVLQTGRPHHVAQLSRSFFPSERRLPGSERLAALGLPVRGRGVVMGALYICGPRDLLSEGELKLIQGLADALGALVDRARQDLALTTLIDHLPDAVLEQDALGRISAAGGRLVGTLGRAQEALLGVPVADLLAPEDRERFAQVRIEVSDGVVGTFTIVRPDGTRVACEVSAHVSRVEGTVRAIFRDVSARLALEAEVQASQLRAIRADRLASIGTLAAGVAHEINNPLAFVKSNVAVQRDLFSELRDALPDASAEVKGLLAELEEIGLETVSGIDRIASIVKLLKLQAREATAGAIECDIAQAVQESVRFFIGAKQRNAVDCHLPDLPKAVVDPGKLGQVIMNLLENGLDAMGDTGVVVIRGSADPEFVKITVADQGTGIPAHVATHIFEPFFTTKGVGKGTGLGLHISHEIIAQSGGTLTFTTGPTGTTFTIALPRK